MNGLKIILTNKIHAEEFETLTKTDNYTIVVDDIGKLIELNSSSDKIFTFATFSSTYNGSRVRCSSINTGELKVQPYSGGTINGLEYVVCKYQYGVIEFLLIDTDTWIITSTDGRKE